MVIRTDSQKSVLIFGECQDLECDCFFFFGFAAGCLWDLSSWTRDGTLGGWWGPEGGWGSTEP